MLLTLKVFKAPDSGPCITYERNPQLSVDWYPWSTRDWLLDLKTLEQHPDWYLMDTGSTLSQYWECPLTLTCINEKLVNSWLTVQWVVEWLSIQSVIGVLIEGWSRLWLRVLIDNWLWIPLLHYVPRFLAYFNLLIKIWFFNTWIN